MTLENLDEAIVHAIENPTSVNADAASLVQTHRDWVLAADPDFVFRDRDYGKLERAAEDACAREIEEIQKCRVLEAMGSRNV